MKIKERPILFSEPMVKAILAGRKTQTRRVVKDLFMTKASGKMMDGEEEEWCPYGRRGDRLWVRETFQAQWDDRPIYRRVIYRADAAKAIGAYGCVKWTPSIFMPRWASRITLAITKVRAERLQDMTRDDATSEGVDLSEELFPNVNAPDKALRRFPKLWDSINRKTHPWSSNPWVWVIEFKRLLV